MNILPHKSWHVWKAKNLARVEQDEYSHSQKQAQLKEANDAVVREERFLRLREKARFIPSNSSRASDVVEIPFQKSPHNHERNKQHEYPKRSNPMALPKEDVKKRKRNLQFENFGCYFGGDYEQRKAVEENRVWMLSSQQDLAQEGNILVSNQVIHRMKRERRKSKDEALKSVLDPLTLINSTLQIRKNFNSTQITDVPSPPRTPISSDKIMGFKKENSSRASANKKVYRRKENDNKKLNHANNDKKSSKSLINQLRDERLAREARERDRISSLK